MKKYIMILAVLVFAINCPCAANGPHAAHAKRYPPQEKNTAARPC
jgi:hypothetical protein